MKAGSVAPVPATFFPSNRTPSGKTLPAAVAFERARTGPRGSTANLLASRASHHAFLLSDCRVFVAGNTDPGGGAPDLTRPGRGKHVDQNDQRRQEVAEVQLTMTMTFAQQGPTSVTLHGHRERQSPLEPRAYVTSHTMRIKLTTCGALARRSLSAGVRDRRRT